MKQIFALPITISAVLFVLSFTFTMAQAQEGQEENGGGIFGTIMVGGDVPDGKAGAVEYGYQ